jgi:hypothetical protein
MENATIEEIIVGKKEKEKKDRWTKRVV